MFVFDVSFKFLQIQHPLNSFDVRQVLNAVQEANEAEEISKAKEESHENSDPHFGENAFETPKKRCEPIEQEPQSHAS